MRTHVRDSQIVFTIPLNGTLTQLAVPGRIFSVTKSDRNSDKSLSQFCPDCEAPIQYHAYCRDGHGPHVRTALLRGKKVPDDQGNERVVIVDTKDEDTDEDITKSSLARGKLTVTPVTRQSLVDGTTPMGSAYHFMPIPADATDREAYAILHSAITDNPDWAFVCRANIGKGSETLVSIEAGAYGGLTLQNLAYPEMLYTLPTYEVEPVTKANKANIRTLLAPTIGEFDPEEWGDRQAAVIAEAVGNAASAKPSRRGEKPKTSKKKQAETAPSLLDAISTAAKQAS